MTTPPNGRRTYSGARALAVIAAVILLAPFYPQDRFPTWFEFIYFAVLGITAGQIGKACARINEADER